MPDAIQSGCGALHFRPFFLFVPVSRFVGGDVRRVLRHDSAFLITALSPAQSAATPDVNHVTTFFSSAFAPSLPTVTGSDGLHYHAPPLAPVSSLSSPI